MARLRGAVALIALIVEMVPSAASAQATSAETILQAVATGDTMLVAELLESDPSLVGARDPQGQTPLHAAASKGNAAMERLLLSRGADTDARDNMERTPLFFAAAFGGDRAVRLLLDAGADVNALTPTGQSAFFYALQRGDAGIVDLLLDRGARLPAQPRLLVGAIFVSASSGLDRVFRLGVEEAERQEIPWRRFVDLHQAARGGSVAIGQLLLEGGADVNAREVHGSTPLTVAAEAGHLPFVEWLVEHGASLDATTPSGMRALDYARAGGHEDVSERLLALGASPSAGTFPDLRGPYLGQPEPTDGPAMFAPGIVSLNLLDNEHSPVVVSPDGTELYWGLPFRQPIMGSRLIGGRWSPPEPASFNSSYTDGEAFFAPDGRRVYFLSTRPLTPGGDHDVEHIWFVEREGDGWSEPQPASAAVNAFPHHWLFSLSRDGALYFSAAAEGGFGDRDIYRAPMVDGVHQAPENLGPVINTAGTEQTPFIAPDESYLIFASRGRAPSDGRFHLYISYRGTDGGWLPPQGLDAVTGALSEPLCPAVTPDGRFMFFIASGDIWWVKADFIEAMRPSPLRSNGDRRR